jgi:hypothetical protein
MDIVWLQYEKQPTNPGLATYILKDKDIFTADLQSMIRDEA